MTTERMREISRVNALTGPTTNTIRYTKSSSSMLRSDFCNKEGILATVGPVLTPLLSSSAFLYADRVMLLWNELVDVLLSKSTALPGRRSCYVVCSVWS